MHCITYSRQNLLYEKDYFLREIYRNESFKTKNFDSIKFIDKVPSRACLDFPYHLSAMRCVSSSQNPITSHAQDEFVKKAPAELTKVMNCFRVCTR